MTIKFSTSVVAGLAAAVLSASLLTATTAQAESRTFPYGSYGSAKYEGFASVQLRNSSKRRYKRSQSALRPVGQERRRNFSSTRFKKK